MTVMNASSTKCQMSFIMTTQVSPCYETFRIVHKSYIGYFLDQALKLKDGKSGSITGK